jgi:protein TonB
MKAKLISAALHAAIIVLCIVHRTADARPKPTERSPIVIYHPPAPYEPLGMPHGHGATGTPTTTIPVPTTVPPNIPPIDIQPPGPPRVPLDTIWSPNPNATRFGEGGKSSGSSLPTGVLGADVVDVQVTPYAGAPAPRYPEALRSAGVEGDVTIEFVVDTLGRVEAGSMRKISSTADAFFVSVCDAVTGTLFHPALVAGRRVRQLVRQQFVFSLTH